MRIVVIDSPGPGPEPHWSVAFAAELAARLRAGAAEVVTLSGALAARGALHEVAQGQTDVALEAELTRQLRHVLVDVVVHVGVGTRGSPNPLWLAARMGSATVAVVRAAEVVCQRGDLVTEAGAGCAEFLDADRCSQCCRQGRRRATADDFRNRLDLIVAGLQSCALVWLPSGDAVGDVDLTQVGVPKAAVCVAPAAELAGAVAAGLFELSAAGPSSS